MYAAQVTFQPTPLMPTYLLAFCAGRLKGKSLKTAAGINITVWAPPSLEEFGEVDVALDVSLVHTSTCIGTILEQLEYSCKLGKS